MPLSNNTTLRGGTYKIIRFLNQGGFGCTYEVEHTIMGVNMALKEFFVSTFCNREDSGLVSIGTQSQSQLVHKLESKFIAEARSLFKLRHPGIVRVTDVFEENGTAYYAMDFINGKSLQKIVTSEGPLTEAKALEYIFQVCDALEYVHSKKMLHLDLKPDNIMVDEHDRAIIIDFGASKQYDEVDGHNTSTVVSQTPGYAPIEQTANALQQFSPATDIYSLAATLYYLLSGKTPPTSNNLAFGEVLPPLSDEISQSTKDTILKSMSIRGIDRPQSVMEFREMLRNNNNGAKTEVIIPNSTKTNENDAVSFDDEKTNISEEGSRNTENATDNALPANDDDAPAKKGGKKKLLLGVLAAVALAGGAWLITSIGGNDDKHEDKAQAQAETTAPSSLPKITSTKHGNTEVFTVGNVKFNMMDIGGGTFKMGSSDSNANIDETPEHNVSLKKFALGDTEVTIGLWKAVMGSAPSTGGDGDNCPVTNVSYNDCLTFIDRLNQASGRKFRLPTEAEWEYAAREGSANSRYAYSGSNNIGQVAWFTDNSDNKPHPVATKQANSLGLYDMTGNVAEWCADWYKGSYYKESPTKNPTGPENGRNKVVRGGGFTNAPDNCNVSNRASGDPAKGQRRIGFRLAL